MTDGETLMHELFDAQFIDDTREDGPTELRVGSVRLSPRQMYALKDSVCLPAAALCETNNFRSIDEQLAIATSALALMWNASAMRQALELPPYPWRSS